MDTKEMQGEEFGAWLKKVDEELRKKDPETYRQAIEITDRILSEVDQRDDLEKLYGPNFGITKIVPMRGDEPFETYLIGDSPKFYAKFLIEEWEIFGPEGE